MALLNLGDDPWLLEHSSCEKLHCDIMEQLSLRQKEYKTSENYARISASIRLRLKQFNNEVQQLKQKLKGAFRDEIITFEENERRTRQVEILVSKGMRMQKLFDDQTITNTSRERSQLFDNEWGAGSSRTAMESKELSTQQLKLEQRRMLEDQEAGLENLSQIIARQKNIAETISKEVDLQNDIIDDLGDHIDRTDVRIARETKHIDVVDSKDKTCIYWVVIIILFISIITVVII